MSSVYDFVSFQDFTLGAGARKELRRLTAPYGDRYLFVHDRHLTAELRADLEASVHGAPDAFVMAGDNPLGRSAGLMDDLPREEVPPGVCSFYEPPAKACCRAAIDEVGARVREEAPDIVVAVGGSKCLDLVRAALHHYGRHRPALVLLPTVVASNASANGMSVLYDEAGAEMVDFWNLAVMPEVCIIDTGLVVKTPPATLAAAIGDQVASSVEALHTLKATGLVEGTDPLCIAHHRAVLDVLAQYGPAAMDAMRAGAPTKELDWVLHAVCRYTGPELAVATSYFAHVLDEALIALPAAHDRMHGERVGFGVMGEMMAFGTPEEMLPWAELFRAIGVPVTLEELGAPDATYEDLLTLCEAASDKIMASRAMVPQDPAVMARAVIDADAYVREHLG